MGRYFYGTDNHLSTNGVTMRTAQVIDALTKQPARGDCAVILVCALAALTTVLALAAHRRAWSRSARHGFGCCGGFGAGTGCVHPHNAALSVDSLRRRNCGRWEGAYEFHRTRFRAAFPIVLACIGCCRRGRRVLLLAASLEVLRCGQPQALPLLAGITLGTYAAAWASQSQTQTAKSSG